MIGKVLGIAVKIYLPVRDNSRLPRVIELRNRFIRG